MNSKGFVLLIVVALAASVQAALPVTDGLVIHLEADSAGIADSGPVAAWPDLSGSGNDGIQATADDQPVYDIANPLFNGHATVHFDGADDFIDLPEVVDPGSFTVFIVAKFDVLGVSQYLCSAQGTDGGNDRLRIQIDAAAGGAPFLWRAGSSTWPGITVPANADIHIFGMTSAVEGFLDGVSVGTTANTSPESPVSDFLIGAAANATNSFLSGDIAELIVFDRVLTSQEIAGMSSYLAQKYVVSGSGSSAPVGLTATAADSSISLDWVNTEPNLASYNVYRDTESGGPYTQIASGVLTSDYVDNTIINGTTYYYVVTAVNTSSEESGYSNETSAIYEVPFCLVGDLHIDCVVDLLDLVEFADQWLDSAGASADFVGDNGVDLDDFGIFARNWLNQGDFSVVINEIHHNPDGQVELVEFVELYNPSPYEIDISGWRFCDGIVYEFPPGTTLPAGGYIVVAEDASQAYTPVTIMNKYGVSADLVYGPFTGSLSNEGEKIELCNSLGQQVDQVDYQLGFPWPTVGDGDSIQLVNSQVDNDLGGSWRSAYSTPGAENTAVYANNIPPHIRQVKHEPQSPGPNDVVTITAKVTDPDGVASVTLYYQLVDPGNYIPINFLDLSENPAYEDPANWTGLAMHDDGTGGDEFADDDMYSVQMPSALQIHRRLVRYRIRVEDSGGRTLTVPYNDDPQPNFAYFVYDGVPAWSGADQPGVTPVVTYDMNVMNSLPVYHLIAVESDVLACQYNSTYNNDVYRFAGTLVYDGEVYDHVHFRVKGENDPYRSGKNRWKFRFNRGHYFQACDDYGKKYPYKWELMNLSSCINVWNYARIRGASGMDEAACLRFFNMVGVPACTTNWFQFRIIDDAVETDPTDQYSGDFWGLYMTIEQPGEDFLERNGLDDGSVYKMRWSGGPSKTNQGATQTVDFSDLNAFSGTSGYNKTNPIQDEAWWRQNVNLGSYYGYRSVMISVNHHDHADNHNHLKYHSPTGQWWMLPWDVDNIMYWDYDSAYPNEWEHFYYALGHEPIEIEAKNRGREIRDLLFNGEQSDQLIDELASVIKPDPQGLSLVEANRALWDYHPRIKDKGYFFDSYVFSTPDFTGCLDFMKEYVISGQWPWGGPVFEQFIADDAIPDTPNVWATCNRNFPENNLTFECSAYNDPQGTGTFAAMKWCVAEVGPFSAPLVVGGGGGTGGTGSTIILLDSEDTSWKYYRAISSEPSDPVDAWRMLGFDDSSWQTGQTSIGYGDGDDNTDLSLQDPPMRDNYNTIYLRNTFEITNLDEIESFDFDVYVDDGCIIWINGTEITRQNCTSEFKAWDADTGLGYVEPAWYNIILPTPYDSYFVEGTNIIAIHVLNDKPNSSDLSIDATLTATYAEPNSIPESASFVYTGKPGKYEIDPVWESDEITTFSNTIQIPADGVKPGNTYRVRCKMKDDTGRWSHWSDPNQFVVGEAIDADIRSYLRLTELMYNNGDADFIELKNTSSTVTLDLSNVSITNGVDFSFAGSNVTSLAPGDFVLVVKDLAVFQSQYGTGLDSKIAGVFVSSSLSNSGETIKIEDYWNGTIIEFAYNDARGWPLAADGAGHSLIPLPLTIEDQPLGTLHFGDNWRQSTYISGSPGADDPTPTTSVVINEFMAHTDYSNPSYPDYDSNDWIELYNAGTSSVGLDGNWYLSDDPDNLKKWALPSSTLNAGSRISYDEITGFHSPITSGFGLDKAGEQIFLSYLPGTSADRVVDCISFKGQENFISLSRYPDADTYWFSTSPTTQDAANTNPVNHVVISEIMYHALPDTPTQTYDEYIELYNPTGSSVDLWTITGPWAIDGGVNYEFPASTSLASGDRILVVDFDPFTETARLDAFEATYGTGNLTAGVDIFGPWSGDLSNNGERVTLEKPQDSDDPLDPTAISWIIVDECIYNDYWPWPTEPDGTGQALSRLSSSATASGNNAANWTAQLPTPGW